MSEETVNIYGCVLTKREAGAVLALLTMEEAKQFNMILDKLIAAAESNSMNDFAEGQDVGLSQLRREQFLGERKALRKISRLPEVLREHL